MLTPKLDQAVDRLAAEVDRAEGELTAHRETCASRCADCTRLEQLYSRAVHSAMRGLDRALWLGGYEL